MELNKNQWRFVNTKNLGYQFLKGKKLTGKTTAAVYRIVNIENNYRLFPGEKIAYIVSKIKQKDKILSIYNDAKEKMEDKYFSLFSFFNKGAEVISLEELISSYLQGYLREKMNPMRQVTSYEQDVIISNLYENERINFKKSRFIQNVSCDFLTDEIKWVKSNAFSFEEYLMVKRTGREARIGKNSYTREALFKMTEIYNEMLVEKGLYDKEDEVYYALKYAEKETGEYTHIVFDDCTGLTLVEAAFVNALLKREEYSSMVYIFGEEKFLINPFRDIEGKTFRFSTQYISNLGNFNPIEEYEFIDINKGIIRLFSKDTSSNAKEIIVNNGDESYILKEDSIKEFPLFDNIAAGEPILINEDIQDSVYLPEAWIKNSKDTFLLHVKGDSMKNANIDHGDIVVINKRSSANHNEIVAVNIEGRATLKRLKLNGEVPVLMPENESYEPIILQDKEAAILGVAAGIIKSRNNR
ncbi:MAG: LexA family transcriptional regulator [Clostridiaceae bacterium]